MGCRESCRSQSSTLGGRGRKAAVFRCCAGEEDVPSSLCGLFSNRACIWGVEVASFLKGSVEMLHVVPETRGPLFQQTHQRHFAQVHSQALPLGAPVVPFYSFWVLGSHLHVFILYQQKKGSLIVIWLLGYREPAVSDN